jgi:hypothetical protein
LDAFFFNVLSCGLTRGSMQFSSSSSFSLFLSICLFRRVVFCGPSSFLIVVLHLFPLSLCVCGSHDCLFVFSLFFHVPPPPWSPLSALFPVLSFSDCSFDKLLDLLQSRVHAITHTDEPVSLASNRELTNVQKLRHRFCPLSLSLLLSFSLSRSLLECMCVCMCIVYIVFAAIILFFFFSLLVANSAKELLSLFRLCCARSL